MMNSSNATDRDLLRSLEAEQAVLGDILYRAATIYDVADMLNPADFWSKQHQAIFQACIDLGDRIDVVTVAHHLGETYGDMSYLAEMARNAVATGHARHYAEIIKDFSRRRQLAALSQRMHVQVHQENADTVIATTAEALNNLDKEGEDVVVAAREVSGAWIDQLEHRIKAKGQILGLPTGLYDLDRKLRGLCPGRLYVLAGRPAMGKSIAGLKLALEAAKAGHPALIVSLEMPRDEILTRIHASLGRIDMDALESGIEQNIDFNRIVSNTDTIESLPLYIADRGRLSITGLVAIAKRYHRRFGLKLLVVDYLQLLDGLGENRTQQIGSISRGLKQIAMELGIPVVALSQLNRGVEQRQDKRPMLSDLRESGDVEQDADVVLMLYRDEVYEENTDRKGVCEILIRKFRNGQTGTVSVAFLGQYADLGDLANQPPPPIRHRQGGYEL